VFQRRLINELAYEPTLDEQIDCVQDDGRVRFAEGSAVAADTILYCTGLGTRTEQ
jgi:hypothetical protein